MLSQAREAAPVLLHTHLGGSRPVRIPNSVVLWVLILHRSSKPGLCRVDRRSSDARPALGCGIGTSWILVLFIPELNGGQNGS